MKVKVSVREVTQTRGSLFSATVTVFEWGETKTYDVHTDKYGSGLWIDDKQVTGTCQFFAPTKAAFRSAMYRWFKE